MDESPLSMNEALAYAGPRPRDRQQGRRGPAVSTAGRPTRALAAELEAVGRTTREDLLILASWRAPGRIAVGHFLNYRPHYPVVAWKECRGADALGLKPTEELSCLSSRQS